MFPMMFKDVAIICTSWVSKYCGYSFFIGDKASLHTPALWESPCSAGWTWVGSCLYALQYKSSLKTKTVLNIKGATDQSFLKISNYLKWEKSSPACEVECGMTVLEVHGTGDEQHKHWPLWPPWVSSSEPRPPGPSSFPSLYSGWPQPSSLQTLRSP